jgi:hypothetical protein
MAQEDYEHLGVLEQHSKRMAEDAEYREAALTPPGNHPPGGHVADDQLLATGEPAKQLPADDAKSSRSASKSSK